MEKSYAIISKSESLTKALIQELDALGFNEYPKEFPGNNLYVYRNTYKTYGIYPLASQTFYIPQDWKVILETLKQRAEKYKVPAIPPPPPPTPAYVECIEVCSGNFSGSTETVEIPVGAIYQVLVFKSKINFPDGSVYVLKYFEKELTVEAAHFQKSTKKLYEEFVAKSAKQVGYYYDGTNIFYVSESDSEDIYYDDHHEGYAKSYDDGCGILTEYGKSNFIGKDARTAEENLPVVTFGTINYHYDLERKEFYKAGRTIRFSEIINFFERLYSLEIESYQIIIDEDSTIHFGCHDGTFGELEKVYESIKLL